MKSVDNIRQLLTEAMEDRILIMDGAMGTMIQKHKLEEEDFRNQRFQDHVKSLKGNNDLLSLTQPRIVIGIHKVNETLHAIKLMLACDYCVSTSFS